MDLNLDVTFEPPSVRQPPTRIDDTHVHTTTPMEEESDEEYEADSENEVNED